MTSETQPEGCRPPPTEANGNDGLHEIQLRYKLSPPTIKLLCSIISSPDRRQVLEQASKAIEFRSFPVKPAEKTFFRYVNEHTSIPYPFKGEVTEPWHKTFLLVQIDLSGAGWPNKISAQARKDLYQDRGRIYLLLNRLLRCLVDILGYKKDGRGVTVALDVLRSISAGVWEGSSTELLQVAGIGPAKMETLAKADIKTVKQLSQLEFYHIERLLSRNPPFGQNIRKQLSGFPALTMHVNVLGTYGKDVSQTVSGGDIASVPLKIVRVVLGLENVDVPVWKQKTPWTTLVVEGDDGRLLWFWRGSTRSLQGSKDLVVGLDVKNGETVKLSFACEGIVGSMVRMAVDVGVI